VAVVYYRYGYSPKHYPTDAVSLYSIFVSSYCWIIIKEILNIECKQIHSNFKVNNKATINKPTLRRVVSSYDTITNWLQEENSKVIYVRCKNLFRNRALITFFKPNLLLTVHLLLSYFSIVMLQEFKLRLDIERSRAIKCPTVAFHLAGCKKIQQVLAEPGVLERFIQGVDVINDLRSTFVGLYKLDTVSKLS
jgi:hypothetical protein